MEFKQALKHRANQVELLLKEYMPKEEGYQKTIMEAMNYSLSAGGKRLRPILTMEACNIVGGNVEDAIPTTLISLLAMGFGFLIKKRKEKKNILAEEGKYNDSSMKSFD